MTILQSIDYKKVTLFELKQQKERIVADKLKTLLPNIEIKTNIYYEALEGLEKTLKIFHTLAEKTKSAYQTQFDEQQFIYTISLTAECFSLKERDVRNLFYSYLSEETIDISPTTDEQGNPCVSITKHFSF